jgi:HlyD family secretion protein
MDIKNKTVIFNRFRSLIAVFFALILISGCSPTDSESDAYGNFEATEVVISSEVGGKLLSWNVHEGMELDSAQVVGLSDTISFSLQRAQTLSQMAVVSSKRSTVDAQTAVIQEQLNVADTERKRILSMFESGAATQKQVDDVQGQIRVLTRQLESTQVQKSTIAAELDALTAQMDLTVDQIRRATVLNPVPGTVLANYVEFGEMVTPGKPLYRIANLKEMTLRAFVDARQLADLAIGQSVEVLTDASSSGLNSVGGTVSWISPRAEFTPRTIQTRDDRVTLVYAIKIRVPNDGTIKIGMPGEVRFTRVE